MGKGRARMFSPCDDQVIMHSGVIKDYYLKYSELFNELNEVKFHGEFHNEIARRISEAENILSDAFVVKSQVRVSSEVTAATKLLVNSLNRLRFMVISRFSDDKQVVQEFRFSNIGELARCTDLFIGYSKDVLVMIDKYRDDLAEEGLMQKHIDDTNDKIELVDLKRRQQVETIQSRPVYTQKRIEMMNELWRLLVMIRNAANIIFVDQPEIKALFQLPKQTHKKSDEEGVAEETTGLSQ